MHKRMNKMNKPTAAIFVDYDNIFIAMNQYYRDFSQPLLPYTFLQTLKEHVSRTHNIVLFNLYADLQNVRIGYTGFNILNECDVNLQHVPKGKNSSDIVLILEAYKCMQQYSFLDKIIIVSSDSDMLPICKEARLHNINIAIAYMASTTSIDYMDKLREQNISTICLEQLLGLTITSNDYTLNELFGRYTSNKEYFHKLLIQLNEIIRDVYEKYLREDKYGNIVSAGAVSLSALSYHIKDRHLVPEYICAKYEEHSVFVQMLVQYGVLQPLTFKNKYQELTTWILSPKFLKQYAFCIPRLIDEECFNPA